ncbi:MAG: penicillin acylase family protein [Maribacter sp.]|nr:penicillin acylase family protein [Maribacter sp.]
MKRLKKIGIVLVAILGILLVATLIFIYSLKPDYAGEKEMAKLTDTVAVHFDTYGIPHIYAQNEADAFRALGYVHAQDRLWQMELLRRVARGGLSEVFGEKLIGTDKFFLSLGIDEASKKTVDHIDTNSEMVQLSQAYLDGINQFIETGPTPIEFYLTGIDKEPFTLLDMYNSVGYMAFSFAMAHKTDPLLTNIKDKLGPAYLTDLDIDGNPNTTLIKNYNPKNESIPNSVTALVTQALQGLSLPLFEGSNSWVIAPQKTKNGHVLFANDPHIGFAQPSVWYEAHLSTPTYEKYGYHLAGVPFPLLGHNRELAYGLTMFENDDVDFYYEETNPADTTQYKTAQGWATYQIIRKTIKVKKAKDVQFMYKMTSNGPVLNGIADQITGERPISMSWIYAKFDNKVMDALYGIAHAHDLKGFKRVLPDIHAPGLNVMYGDAKGNVAWFATAKLYKMPDSVSTKFILDGTTDKDKPLRYLDFLENPQAVNPPWNYVYSANNQPDSIAGMFYPGYYLPENRAKRITELLKPKNDWDKEAVMKMITDATSSVNPTIVQNFLKLISIKTLDPDKIKILDQFREWKGDYPLGSIEATVYNRWVYFFLKNTFEDELGPAMFKQFLATHFHKRLIAPMSGKPKSVWWDDISTKDTIETQTTIVNVSFEQAMTSLRKDLGKDMTKWTWEKVHTLEHPHPIGQIKALRSFFNVGPFSVDGTREVINNMSFPYDSTGYYKVNSGPSTRRVIDFSDIENSMSILPTGQSGNPFSPHYEDQAELYNKGEFRKMLLNKEEIIETSKSVLTFHPATNK